MRNGLTNENDYDHDYDYDYGLQPLRLSIFSTQQWLEPVIVVVVVVVVVLVC
ncbi:MAG: hypothetical protein WEE89_05325 [Gemmatimonadota bacterium]